MPLPWLLVALSPQFEGLNAFTQLKNLTFREL